MKKFNTQSGIGLVEVLVSLLLLAIAVLGFTSLQLRSVQATDESLKRTQAMSVIRGLSEDLRTNVEVAETFRTVITEQSATEDVGNITLDIEKVVSTTPEVKISKTISKDSCHEFEEEPCTDVHIAARDALQALTEAEELEINLGMAICPGTEITTGSSGSGSDPDGENDAGSAGTASNSDLEQTCIIAAWGETKPVFDDSDDNACASVSGVYNINANCIIVGAY